MSAKRDTRARTGRKKPAQGKERSDAAVGHALPNTSSSEGAKASDNIRAVLNDGSNRNLWPLPKTWSWSTVGQLTEVIRGASPRPKGDPRYFGGDVPWIMIADVTRQPGKYLYKTRENVTAAGAALSRKICAGELILSNSATVCVPKILKVDGCIHDGFVAFPTLKERVNLDFAYYWFEFVRPTMIQENRQGVTQVNLNTGIVREMHFPLAPLSEQLRIVAEIEKQLTRLESGVAALRRVQANLKRYRAAVLKAACEGHLVPTEAELQESEGRGQKSKAKFETGEVLLARILTERRQWFDRKQADAKMKKKYVEPAKPEINNLPSLPDGWIWGTWNQLSDWVTYGFTRPMPHVDAGIPIITAKGVNKGRIDFDGAHLTTKDAYVKLSEKDRPQPGDILITKDGTIGRAAVVDTDRDFCINQSVAVIWLRSCPMERKFMLTVIESELTQKPIWAKARGVAIQHLSITDFAKMAIPIPPLAEQRRIVAEVERRLSVVEELESLVTANLQRATRLRQSILQKAFSG
jgi:type I restriction enzyme S subunit